MANLPQNEPNAAARATRASEVADKAAEYPLEARPIGTRTMSKAARMARIGLTPGSEESPDDWLPEREVSRTWSDLDETRRDAALGFDLGIHRSLPWTAFFNTYVPRIDLWWDCVPIEEKLDAQYSPYGTAMGSVPASVGKWHKDEHFANQRLSGVNPMTIERVQSLSALNAIMDVDDALLQPTIDLSLGTPGKDLATLIQEKRLYVCNYTRYPKLRDVAAANNPKILPAHAAPNKVFSWLIYYPSTRGAAQWIVAPVALFVWEGELGSGTEPTDSEDDPDLNGRLLPLAIQLRESDTRDEVFLPHHPNWFVAKIAVQVTDALIHEMRYHLGWTHMVMEGFALTAEHAFHETHPLLEFLRPHYKQMMRIQAQTGDLTDPGQAMEVLLGMELKDSLELLEEACKDWDFPRHACIDDEIETRGMSVADAPISYPYRDDGLRIMRCLKSYINDFIDSYYLTDQDVANDIELQAFVSELQTSGTDATGNSWRAVNLTPYVDASGALVSVDKLKEMLAPILWSFGPQHAAINFSQWDYSAHVPNMPFALYVEPPDSGISPHKFYGVAQTLMQYFPPDFLARLQTSTMFVLGTERIGRLDEPAEGLTDPAAREANRVFRESTLQLAAERISNANDARRARGVAEYPYLEPHNIPKSTNV